MQKFNYVSMLARNNCCYLCICKNICHLLNRKLSIIIWYSQIQISPKKKPCRFWGHTVRGAIITSKYRCIECVHTFRQTNHCKGKFIFITRISILQLGNIDLNNRQLQTYICIQLWLDLHNNVCEVKMLWCVICFQ